MATQGIGRNAWVVSSDTAARVARKNAASVCNAFAPETRAKSGGRLTPEPKRPLEPSAP